MELVVRFHSLPEPQVVEVVVRLLYRLVHQPLEKVEILPLDKVLPYHPNLQLWVRTVPRKLSSLKIQVEHGEQQLLLL